MYEVIMKYKNGNSQVCQCIGKEEADASLEDAHNICDIEGDECEIKSEFVSPEQMQMRMQAKPILFKPELIEKIEKGVKTATRRLVKQPVVRNGDTGVYKMLEDGRTFEMLLNGYENIYDYPVKAKFAKGDILYVQEAFQILSVMDDKKFPELHIMFRNGDVRNIILTPERFDKFKKFYGKNGWQSPYFMPKEAARLYLRVNDVRVEHLQDINSNDYHTPISIKAEGLYEPCLRCPHVNGECKDFIADNSCLLMDGWIELWDSTLTPEQKKAGLNYESNPFVAAYEFEVVSN